MANTVSKILSDDTLNRIIQIESAGNPNAQAPTSSAAGLGQFIKGTWIATARKHKPSLFTGRTQDQVAALRVGAGTAALQLEMLARFTEDNAAALGRGFTDGDLYLAHFLGIGDARKLFRAPPADAAASHVTAAAVKANRSILSGKSCAQVRAWAQASMENRWVKAGKRDWVKKFADPSAVIPAPPDVQKPPPKQPAPPTTTKQKTGFAAFLALVIAAVATFINDHPVLVFGGIALAIALVAGGVWWRRHKARNDIPLGEE